MAPSDMGSARIVAVWGQSQEHRGKASSKWAYVLSTWGRVGGSWGQG